MVARFTRRDSAHKEPTPKESAEEFASSQAPIPEIDTVIRALEAFRAFDPDMPIQYALSFLTLAQNEGMSMGDLAHRLGIAQSSASRNVAALSKWHSFGKPGHDLVEAREDPRERRRKIIKVTPAGRRLVEALRDIVSGEPAPSGEQLVARPVPTPPNPRGFGQPVRS